MKNFAGPSRALLDRGGGVLLQPNQILISGRVFVMIVITERLCSQRSWVLPAMSLRVPIGKSHDGALVVAYRREIEESFPPGKGHSHSKIRPTNAIRKNVLKSKERGRRIDLSGFPKDGVCIRDTKPGIPIAGPTHEGVQAVTADLGVDAAVDGDSKAIRGATIDGRRLQIRREEGVFGIQHESAVGVVVGVEENALDPEFGIDAASGDGLTVAGDVVRVVAGIHDPRQRELTFVVDALDSFRAAFGLSESGQEQRSQNGYDSDHNQQLDECEASTVVPIAHAKSRIMKNAMIWQRHVPNINPGE